MDKSTRYAMFVAASFTLLILSAGPAAPLAEASTTAPAPRSGGETALAKTLRGPQPFLTILCKLADVADEPQPPSHFENLLLGPAPSLDDYWREVSYGTISLEGSRVVGWYVLEDRAKAFRQTEDVDLIALAHSCLEAAASEVSAQEYTGFNLVFNANLDSRPYGTACLKDRQTGACRRVTWIWPAQFKSMAYWAHEMGHAFGLAHVLNSDGLPYRNSWTIMSDSASCREGTGGSIMPQHPSAHEKDWLGWIPAGRRFTMGPDATATIALERLSQPSPSGYLLAVIPWPGGSRGYYTVEARRRTGYDMYLGGEGVVIHSVDPTASPVPARLIAWSATGHGVAATAWTPGASFVDAGRSIAVTVEHDEQAGFVVTLRTGHFAANFAPAVPSTTVAPVVVSSQPVAESQTASGSMVRTQNAAYSAWTGPADPGVSQPYRSDPADVWVASTGGEGDQGQPVRVTSDGHLASKTSVVLATNGKEKVFAAWISQKTRGADLEFATLPPDGSTIATASIAIERINDLSDTAWRSDPALVAAPGGVVHAAWVDARSGRDQIYFASRPAGGAWGPNERLSVTTTDEEASPALSVDSRGNTYAAWISYSPCDRGQGSLGALMFAERPAGGAWQPAAVLARYVAGGREVRPVLVADPSGTIYAAWEAYEEDGVALHLAWRAPGAEWSSGALIARAAHRSLDRPAIALDAGGHVHLAWQAGEGAEIEYAGMRGPSNPHGS